MGKRRDFYRTVDLTVYLGPARHSVSVFATTHDRGDRSRRLLVRASLDPDMPVDTRDRCLDLLRAALDEIAQHPVDPWR